MSAPTIAVVCRGLLLIVSLTCCKTKARNPQCAGDVVISLCRFVFVLYRYKQLSLRPMLQLRSLMLMVSMLLMMLNLPAKAQEDKSGWYLQVGVGTGTSSKLSQMGWNRDTLCYPDQSRCVKHDGYRWFYDLPADTGPSLSAAVGRYWGLLRLELGHDLCQTKS